MPCLRCLGSFERGGPGHTRPSPDGWGLALLFERGRVARDPLQEHLADEDDHRARNDEREHDKEQGDFPDALVLVQSLPCSMAAVELAAGVRKARQQAMVMRMTGSSGRHAVGRAVGMHHRHERHGQSCIVDELRHDDGHDAHAEHKDRAGTRSRTAAGASQA